MQYERDPYQLEIYHEGRKRRLLVAILRFDIKAQKFLLHYESDYLRWKGAIPLGVELPLNRQEHWSENASLFPSFLDRIPDKKNPAYPEYCAQQGISPDEIDPIRLLTSIGRRGPSTFIFEPAYRPVSDTGDALQAWREVLGLTRWEVSQLFNIPELSIFKLEKHLSFDPNLLQLISIYLEHPKVALELLEITGKKVHVRTREKVYNYFRDLQNSIATSDLLIRDGNSNS